MFLILILVVQQLVLHNLQIVCQSEDWHAFCGSAVCTMQSADCTNSQIAAWNIYMHTQYWHYSVNPTIEDNPGSKRRFKHYIIQGAWLVN